ncbi:hypothetical protein C1646_668702 [Rhizophagus diaphanus]|nr:hypothetical protein C1646_668702 [Rhizophagus diaphanus] [Rhizophagus sp. MUCL 43196]
MALPLNKRYEIVFLHEHEAGPKWGYEKIASHIYCSESIVIYWVKKYKQDKDLTDEQKSGQPRKTTKAQDERIVKLAIKKHDITAAEIQQKLDKQGVEIIKLLLGGFLHSFAEKLLRKINILSSFFLNNAIAGAKYRELIKIMNVKGGGIIHYCKTRKFAYLSDCYPGLAYIAGACLKFGVWSSIVQIAGKSAQNAGMDLTASRIFCSQLLLYKNNEAPFNQPYNDRFDDPISW